MSIERCEKCQETRDTDYIVECETCFDEMTNEYDELIKFGLEIDFDSTSFFYEGNYFNLECDIFNGHLIISEVNDENCDNPFTEKETQLLEDSLNDCNIETVRLTKREKRDLKYLKNN